MKKHPVVGERRNKDTHFALMQSILSLYEFDIKKNYNKGVILKVWYDK